MRQMFIALGLLVGIGLFAQDFTPKETDGVRYQVLENLGKRAEKVALVLYLHGRSAKGTDNEAQLKASAVKAIRQYLLDNKIPAIFLVPQCPPGYDWAGRDNKPSYNGKAEALVRKYLERADVDPQRVYLCGVSMGARGAWKMLPDCPDLFAAALIASGRPENVWPDDFTGIPLYVTAGSEELSADPLQAFSEAIKKAGGDIRFDLLEGLNHHYACIKACAPERLHWLFSQKRAVAPASAIPKK